MSQKPTQATENVEHDQPTRRTAIRNMIGGVAAVGLLGKVHTSVAQSGAAVPSSGATSITQMPAWELSAQIHAKKVSCQEVMEAYLAQIGKVNEKVNAIVALQDADGLMKQAAEKDRLLAQGQSEGWMHGFPQAIKDLDDTAGIRTTYGSPVFKDNVPTKDSLMVSRIKGAGAVIVGKTNTPEWGYGSHTYNPVYGTTSNAYNPSTSAGGSSGGAAVAVALEMSPVADGSDFMGSLRNPPGWNNLFSIRPSWGRIPAPGKELFFNQFGIAGSIGKTAADVALLLATQSGRVAIAPQSLSDDANLKALTPLNVRDRLAMDPKGKKIAWLGNWNGYLAMEPEVLEVCEKQGLKYFDDMGVKVEAIQNPTDPAKFWTDVWLPHRHICATSMKGLMEPEATRSLSKPEAIWEYEGSKNYTAQQCFEASVARSTWYSTLLALFDKCDYVAVPTAQLFPFDKTWHWPKEVAGKSMDTYHRWMEIVTHWTMAGNPTGVVPAGFSKAGLPMGIQIVGKPQDDFGVLRIMHAYDVATNIVRKNPPALLKG